MALDPNYRRNVLAGATSLTVTIFRKEEHMLRSSLGGVALLVLALVLLAAPPVEAQAPRANEPASAAAAAAKVDLNTATGEELESLPGVGPRTAELIIEYRKQSDGFQKIEELMNVRGIGEKTFLRLRSLITVTPIKARQSNASSR